MAKKSLFTEFKEFAFKGNVVDMAVGVVIHIFWHANWIQSAAKNIFRKKSEDKL